MERKRDDLQVVTWNVREMTYRCSRGTEERDDLQVVTWNVREMTYVELKRDDL